MQAQYNTRSPAVKRLMREAQELAEPTYDYFAQPLSDNLFEWHFTVRGPADSDFEGGVYHGRIVLPPDYPMKPPNIIVLTPNGRFETGKKICLSISGHHPESWQPSWSIRTALLAIIGFMPTPSQGTIGSLDYSSDERKRLAKKSVHFTCPDCGNVPIYTLLKEKEESATEDNSTAEEAKEIIKTMSMKGENDKKSDESEEEKYKRARKLYSIRMQKIIKSRLNQSSNSSAATTEEPIPVRSAAPINPAPIQTPIVRDQTQANNVQHQVETRSFVYDIVIGVVVAVIALLLYRRINMFSAEVLPEN